jgi:hypothetical protein
MVNCSSDQEGLNSFWQTLGKTAGFITISKPSETIKKKLASGEDLVHADGGHWNQAGNRVFGETLYDELINIASVEYLLSQKNTKEAYGK